VSANRLFSDVWHRVADLRVALRPTVRAHRQHFRGEPWYLLHDPLNNRFFRVRPEAWALLARLTPQRSVEAVWLEALERDPEGAPGQEDVVELLAQLSQANLLYFDQAADGEQLFQRLHQRKGRELKKHLMGFIALRVPLFDPDRLLQSWLPALRWIFGPIGLLLWLGVLLSAIVPLSERGTQALFDQANGALAPDNLFWLYLAIALIKVLHEFGHAISCRHYGGEVHTMGLMFIVFVPLPYMDATSSWGLRSRHQRALVGAAGMVVELFVAALAAWVWAYTAPGVVNAVAFNLMLVASISTLLFNANPLLRFDGYYILSDLLDIPNLYNRSRSQLVYLFEHYLAGARNAHSHAHTRGEAVWLVLFGVGSSAYRLVVFVGITLFVAQSYLLLGALMALMLIATTVVLPPLKMLHYLATSPRLIGQRRRASFAALGLIGLILMLVTLPPAPHRVRVDGVLEAQAWRDLSSETEGRLVRIERPSGSRVRAGETLLTLENPLLDLRLSQLHAAEREATLRLQQARSEAWADLEPLERRLDEMQERVAELEKRAQALRVTAPIDGLWIAPQLTQLRGGWLGRGSLIGRIVDDRAFRLVAVVPQEAAGSLFAAAGEAQVRLHGREGQPLSVTGLDLIPYQHQQLPSAALGWMGGGETAVVTEDASGRQSSEPFFLLRAALADSQMPLWHGQSGVLRIELPPMPLAEQGLRALQQLLQRRFLL